MEAVRPLERHGAEFLRRFEHLIVRRDRRDRPGAEGPTSERGDPDPFALEDDPGRYQTTGWFRAFVSAPAPVAVAAQCAADVADVLAFCAERSIPVVAKGTGHDYLGRSLCPDGVLLWTHGMRSVTLDSAFRPAGASSDLAPMAAVHVGAGARWLDAYQRVDAAGLYVQGGGCTSVGVGGYTLGGGFGSLSRHYGTTAGNLIEVEIVTASGAVLVTNEHQHPDLFWAIRGGGFGLGVLTRLTMRTHRPPSTVGAIVGTVRSRSDQAFRRLIGVLVSFMPSLCDEHWGEQIRLHEDGTLQLLMLAAAISDEEARDRWDPFLAWAIARTDDYDVDVAVGATAFGSFWSASAWDHVAPGMVTHPRERPHDGGRFWWSDNQNAVSQFIHAYASWWLTMSALAQTPGEVADALFQATRRWHVSLHVNKALAGASPEALARDRQTSINPVAFESAALVIVEAGERPVYPGVPGREPHLSTAMADANRVAEAMAAIRTVTPRSGSYVNESDYFEPDWQRSFWGPNYERLLAVKRRYDPDTVFRIHHAVGSEDAEAST